MSYILDALKKADQERAIGEVPDLETAHWGVRRQTRLPKWVWIVGALLLVNGLLLFVMLDRDKLQESASTVSPQYENTLPQGRPARPVVVAPAVPVTPEIPATMRPRVELPPVARLPVAQFPARTEPQMPETAPASQPAPVSSGEFKFPEWRELSLEFRSGFTLPRIDVHVYSEDPRRRFIMADLKKYREGETLVNGAVLEKIYPGSIQLIYQGKRFRVER